MTSSAYLTGRVLVAMPGIGDPRFERAVILVCAHDDQHAMGLALNCPVEKLTIRDLLAKLTIQAGVAPNDPVLIGGPVDTERGFVVHTDEVEGAGQPIGGGLALSATREILEALAGRRPRPRRFAMAIGYAGWDAGQLDREIRESVWLTVDPDESLVFDADHDAKWSRALAKLGVSPERLSVQPGRA